MNELPWAYWKGRKLHSLWRLDDPRASLPHPSALTMSLWSPWLCPSTGVTASLTGSSLVSFCWEPSCFGEEKSGCVLRFGGWKLNMVPSSPPLLGTTSHLDGFSCFWHAFLGAWACSEAWAIRRQAAIPHSIVVREPQRGKLGFILPNT